MKNATTPPAFRLWMPTGEPLPGVGTSGVGFGKAMTDVHGKGFNGDSWRVESFLKRDKESCMWVDPQAQKNSKGGKVSATIGYDDMKRNMKFRSTTDDSLKHSAELAYTLPLLEGQQRVKVQVDTALCPTTLVPKTEDVKTKLFWKAMLPQVTAEGIVKMTKEGTDSVNAWAQGEVSDDIALGGLVSFKNKGGLQLDTWEAGLLNTFHALGGVLATRAVTRNGTDFELGILPPAQVIAGKKMNLYAKANFKTADSQTDLALTAEMKTCPVFDFKAQFVYAKLQTLTTNLAAIWAAPGGWRVSASLTDFMGANKFGVRITQGSTPPPL